MSNVIFLGGVSGTSKAGKEFYILSFGSPSTRSNVFGFESAQVFTDEKTYSEFKKSARPGKEMTATLHFARGGWDLIDYKF